MQGVGEFQRTSVRSNARIHRRDPAAALRWIDLVREGLRSGAGTRQHRSSEKRRKYVGDPLSILRHSFQIALESADSGVHGEISVINESCCNEGRRKYKQWLVFTVLL